MKKAIPKESMRIVGIVFKKVGRIVVVVCAFLFWVLFNLIEYVSRGLAKWLKKWLFPKEF